nr:hypothetical protein [Moorena sp. SIO3I6]
MVQHNFLSSISVVSKLMPQGTTKLFVAIGALKTVSKGLLDVTFNSDASRFRQGHGAQNLGLLRRKECEFTQTGTFFRRV